MATGVWFVLVGRWRVGWRYDSAFINQKNLGIATFSIR